jgi:hypothetical protein
MKNGLDTKGKVSMEKQAEVRSLRERVGISVQPADPATLVANIVEIEKAGVDHAWVAFGPFGAPDVLTTLAAAAARTNHLKLGTAIVQITSRHPVLMAQQVLSLGSLAPGRLRLGIGGTGLPQMAKSIYGIEMDAPLAYLREYIQVLRPLLEQGEVRHQGRYFTVDASLPGSSQVPLLISALGVGAFLLAGEVTAIPALSAGAAAAAQPVRQWWPMSRWLLQKIGRPRYRRGVKLWALIQHSRPIAICSLRRVLQNRTHIRFQIDSLKKIHEPNTTNTLRLK